MATDQAKENWLEYLKELESIIPSMEGKVKLSPLSPEEKENTIEDDEM